MRWLLLLSSACDNPPHGLQQHEVTAPGALLTSDGKLREPGWSSRELQTWDPARVNDASKLRQWDFFTVASDSAAVNSTITDLGFIQLASLGVVDYANSAKHEASVAADQLTLSAAIVGSASLVASGASGSFTIHRNPEMPPR